jgi:hypothetical protein
MSTDAKIHQSEIEGLLALLDKANKPHEPSPDGFSWPFHCSSRRALGRAGPL